MAWAGEPTFHADPAESAPLVAGIGAIELVIHTQVVPVVEPEGKVADPPAPDSWVPPHYSPWPGRASDAILVGAVGLGAALALRDGWGDGEGLSPRLWILGETLGLTLVTTDLLKLFVARPRPYTAVTGDPRVDAMRQGLDSEMSFPSGHTSLTAAGVFCAARMLGLSGGTRRQRVLAWSTAAAAAGTVAALRVAAGKHHPTDVAAGLALGFGYAWVVPWMHTRERPWSVVPTGTGMALLRRW